MNKLKFLALACATSILSSCGGGGGGGDSSSGINYIGITTPAVITTNNAVEITESTLGGAQNSGDIGLVFGVVSEQEQASTPRTLKTAEVIASTAANITFTRSNFLPGAIETEVGTEACSEGGNITFELNVDTVSGEFTGTLTYNSCEEDSTLISGITIVQGQFTSLGELISLTIEFDSISITSEGAVFFMDGTMAISYSPSENAVILVMNLVSKINNQVERFENYVLTVYDSISFAQWSLTGRYYQPDYGYVEISTPTLLYVALTDFWPSSGVLILTGENGSKARITMLVNGQYTLEVDADGDGTYESMTTESWSST